MTVSAELRETVRERARFACEYCGVAENDTGGLLTIDHFQPQVRGGADDAENLLYCCHRCNLYKADYWPAQPTDPTLWNPRHDPISLHLLALADGLLYPITPEGTFTLRRLRLNRPPLVAFRRHRQAQAEQVHLLGRQRDVIGLLEELHRQHAVLLEEHRALLEEQRKILRLLVQTRAG